MKALQHSTELLKAVKQLTVDKSIKEYGYNTDTGRPFFQSKKKMGSLYTVSSRGIVWSHRGLREEKVGRLDLRSDYIILK